MNKMILMFIVVGILVCGIYCSTEVICEDISFEDLDVTEVSLEQPWGNMIPCGGGGGNGSGDVPG